MATSRICSVDGCGKPPKARGWCNAHWLRWSKYGDPAGGGAMKGSGLSFVYDIALRSNAADCLEWPYGLNGKGYGMVRVDGVAHLVHRYVCIVAHGEAPSSEHQAAHSCGNRLCCNPAHIRWATPSENQLDRVIHGTSNRGEQSAGAKLRAADVFDIREVTGKEARRATARRYGISVGHVLDIQSGRRWSWLR